MDQKEVIPDVIKDLISSLEGISKIVLYGSVAHGDFSHESDIDLAFILKEDIRTPDSEGLPPEYFDRLYAVCQNIELSYGHVIHPAVYWDSKWCNGIRIGDGDRNKENLLNKIGKIVFESSN